MENKQEIKPLYIESVDLMFQTYRKELFKCICRVSEIIKDSSAFEGSDLESAIGLLHLLHCQLNAVSSFLNNYKKIDEVQ